MSNRTRAGRDHVRYHDRHRTAQKRRCGTAYDTKPARLPPWVYRDTRRHSTKNSRRKVQARAWELGPKQKQVIGYSREAPAP